MGHSERAHLRESDLGITDASQIISMAPRDLQSLMNEVEATGQMEEFLSQAVQNDALIAHLSYWEKWFPETIRKKIDSAVSQKRQSKEHRPEALPLDLDQKFTPEELQILFSNHGAFQLTFGCSKGCKHCGFDAVPIVRDEMDFEAMKKLFDQYGKEIAGAKWMLYYASEPADSPRFSDYYELMRKNGCDHPHFITAESEKEGWSDFIVNKARANVRTSFARQDVAQLNARRKSVKKVMFDHQEIEIGVEIPPIEVHIQRADHHKNLGFSFSPDKGSLPHGIGCIEGALITPRGIYNVAGIPTSEEFPQGQVVVPLEGVSDEPIEVGQHLKQVLGSCIIVKSDMPVPQIPRDKVTTLVHRKNADYVIKTDYEGVIIEVEKLTPERKQFLYPETTNLEELERIYQDIKLEFLGVAEMRADEDAEPYEQQVMTMVKNDPSKVRFTGRSKLWGRMNYCWGGFVKLPGVPGEFEVNLNGIDHGRYKSDSEERLSCNGLISNRALSNPRSREDREERKTKERKEALYLSENIRNIIKRARITSLNRKPFDYERLLEQIAQMDFTQLYFSPWTKTMTGEFPDSLYEGQPEECGRHRTNDRIEISGSENQELFIIIGEQE